MEKITTTKKPSYEVKIFIGSVDESSKTQFPETSIVSLVSKFQDSRESILPIRISKTSFISGSNYKEDGWELSAINFPKINSWGRSYKRFMTQYMNDLSKLLMLKLNQKRVSVISGKSTYIHENLKFLKVSS